MRAFNETPQMVRESIALENSFTKNGYVIAPRVLGEDKVRALRTLLADAFRKIDSQSQSAPQRLFPRHVLSTPQLYSVAFNERIVDCLKLLLGEQYTLFPDFHVQRNVFGNESGPWHTDCGSEGKADYLLAREYRFVKCGVFLQDNTMDWGGGINVVPGGHRFPIRTPIKTFTFLAKSIAFHAGIRFFSKMLEIRAGDLVAFDSRLPHRSTWPRRKDLREDRYKYVIYWNASRSDQYVANFMMNSERRAESEEVKARSEEIFFSDYLSRHFPTNYSPDFVQEAGKHNIRVASLDRTSAREWSLKFTELMERKNGVSKVMQI